MKKLLLSLVLAVAFLPLTTQAQQLDATNIKVDDIEACDSFTWIDSNTYTADTNIFYSLNDTLHMLVLKINHSTSSTLTETGTCSFNWRGTIYTESTTIVDTLKNVKQCDSIVTINLTLSKVAHDTLDSVVACGMYVWDEDTITTSGLYTHTFIDSTGCEINTILPVTIANTIYRTDSVSLCGKYVWFDSTYTESTIATHEIQTGECDSIFTLVLDIYAINDTVDSVAACQEYRWNVSGQTYTSSGWKTFTKTDETTGCVTNKYIYLTIDAVETVSYDTLVEGCTRIRYKFVDSPAFYVTIDSNASRTFNHNSGYTRYCVDSTVNIQFHIKSVQRNVEDIYACDTFTWNGILHTSNARDSIRIGYASNGCDSFNVANMIISPSPVIASIEGRWRLPNAGETATLTAICDQEDVTYQWDYWTPEAHPSVFGSNLTIENVTNNIDVRLTVTNNESFCTAESWITILVGVGIDEIETTKINLYPNPSQEKINIESEEPIEEIHIFNMIGQEVFSTRSLNNNTVDLSGLSNGTYTLRITLKNGENINRKFVISK